MSKQPLFVNSKGGLRSYLKTCSMDLRDGTIKPSPRLMASFDDISGGVSNGYPGATIVHWTWNTVGSPWVGKYNFIRYFRSGAWSSGPNAGGAQITDLCPFDISGNARVIMCYGNGDFIDAADGLGALTASTDVKLTLATMAGPHLYAVTNAGAYSNWKVSKCPAGSSPLSAANWSAGLPVGSPVWGINSLRAIGAAPVVGKPEGLYIFNEVTSRYENLMKWLENAPHADNGKGMFQVSNGICYPTADGGLFHFDGYTIRDISPRLTAFEHRDNPHTRSRITAGCDTGKWVMVATAPCESGWTKSFGLTVVTLDSPATYADITTNCTDEDYSTGGAVGGLGNGDYIYVGADVPFEAVYFKAGTVNTDGAPYFGRPQYYTTDWQDIGPAASNAPDGTTNTGVMLSVSGWIGWRNFNTAHTSMTKVAVSTYGTRYWVRFPIVSAGNAIAAGTTIAEVRILPSRPGVSTSAALTYTGPDAAGRWAHILAGRPRYGGNLDEGWEWHDLFCLRVHAPIAAMSYADTDAKQTEQNIGPALIMVSQFDNIIALMPQVVMPAAPVNENYADGMTFGTPSVFFIPTDLSDPDSDRATVRKVADEFHVYGEYVDGSDTLTMFSRWDHEKWDKAGSANTSPARVSAPDGNQGLILETALAYEDPDVELAGPRITRVDVKFHDLDEEPFPFDYTVQADQTTPEIE